MDKRYLGWGIAFIVVWAFMLGGWLIGSMMGKGGDNWERGFAGAVVGLAPAVAALLIVGYT
jgi:hypothetical protein